MLVRLIPGAIAGAKLESDLFVAIGNPQRRTGYGIWLGGIR
jgi:hypothetical protein